MKMLCTLLAAALLVSCASNSAAPKTNASASTPTEAAPQPPLEPKRASLSEQKVCAEQAKKAFEDLQRDDGPALGYKTASTDYTSHLDPQRNICYVRVMTVTTAHGNPSDSVVVYDAFERRVFADYVWSNPTGKKYWEVKPLKCEVYPPGHDAITCGSDAEFDSLVAKWFGVLQ